MRLVEKEALFITSKKKFKGFLLISCRTDVSIRFCRMPVFSWIIAEKCVDKSWMSCWRCMASGVGWHSLCEAACQIYVGALSVVFSTSYFSTAQEQHQIILLLSLQLQLHCSVLYKDSCHHMFQGLICFCFVYTDTSLAVFFTYQTVLVSVITNAMLQANKSISEV